MDNDNPVEDTPIVDWATFYANSTTLELIRAMHKVRKQKDDLDYELKSTTAELEFLAKIAIPEKFAEEQIKNMNVDGIGRVGLRADAYASIKAGLKEKAFEWLSDIGSGDLIQPQVAPSTLKAFLKGRLKAGEDIPEELFNFSPYQTATITKV